MKKFVELLESDGYDAGSRCRREKVAGRIELLTAFFDGPPFWFVRLRGRTKRDENLLGEIGNGHWRFIDRVAAESKFEELCTIPEYAEEIQKAEKLRALNQQRARDMVLAGKLKPFK